MILKMKTHILPVIFFTLFCSISVLVQGQGAPESMNYQAVIRDGSLGQGGTGMVGGGGGYYGGGGGSSYAHSTLATNVTFTTGAQTGSGQLIITIP